MKDLTKEQLLYELKELRRTTRITLDQVSRSLMVLHSANYAILTCREESLMFTEVCNILVKEGGFLLAWIGLVTKDVRKRVRPVAQAGFNKGYLDEINITWDDTERGHGPTGLCIRTKKPSIIQNILDDAKFAPWKKQAIKRGYASSVALPLIVYKKVIGAINIYASEPNAFNPEEVTLLSLLADNLAYAIMGLRIQNKGESFIYL